MPSQNKFSIELCCDSLDAKLASLTKGVSRIELCTALSEGGLTPPLSLIERICENCAVPVNVMIRPRSGDFLYSNEEFELMKADITHARIAGASGVVFGVLKSDGTIDRDRCQELLSLASPMYVTFHRAFDMTVEPFFALEEIIAIGCKTLLTSGQHQTAEDGLELIRELVKRAASRIEVMAGGGINSGNAELLYEAGVRTFHFTARKKIDGRMKFKNESLQSMGKGLGDDEYGIYVFDEDKVNQVYKVLTSL